MRHTWSINDKTVGMYGCTKVALIVAPPYAKLYVSRALVLYLVVTKSTQLGTKSDA
jgi:hypothetical protein